MMMKTLMKKNYLMKLTTKVSLVLLSTLFIVGCSTTKPTTSNTEQTQVEKSVHNYTNISNIGSVWTTKDGAMNAKGENTSKVTVDVFFDPLCPHCVSFHNSTKEVLNKYLENGDVSIVYHPVNFLNNLTPDSYSTRMTAFILGVAEYSPKNFNSFYDKVMNGEITPRNNTTTTSDDKIIELMKSSGVSDNEINKIVQEKEKFAEIAINRTVEFRETNVKKYLELSSIDAKGTYTPFITVNKTGEFTSKTSVPKENQNWASLLEEQIQEKLK